MIDKAKTLDECFKELILKRGWSKNSPYDRRTASRHKSYSLKERCLMNLKEYICKVLVIQ
jgi:hypothetical protein